jgi:hypothetical protein
MSPKVGQLWRQVEKRTGYALVEWLLILSIDARYMRSERDRLIGPTLTLMNEYGMQFAWTESYFIHNYELVC